MAGLGWAPSASSRTPPSWQARGRGWMALGPRLQPLDLGVLSPPGPSWHPKPCSLLAQSTHIPLSFAQNQGDVLASLPVQWRCTQLTRKRCYPRSVTQQTPVGSLKGTCNFLERTEQSGLAFHEACEGCPRGPSEGVEMREEHSWQREEHRGALRLWSGLFSGTERSVQSGCGL